MGGKVKVARQPFMLPIQSGAFAWVKGHKSRSDNSIKNRCFHVATHAARRQVDIDRQCLNGWSVLDMHASIQSLYGVNIPVTVVSAALKILDQRIIDRENRKPRGPLETHPVIVNNDNRVLARLVKDQKTELWTFELHNAEENHANQKVIQPGTVDWRAVTRARLEKNIAGAETQSARYMQDPTKSISQVCSLINKVIDAPKVPLRRFTLINQDGTQNVQSVSVGRHTFDNMASIVNAYRPDLSGLLK